MQSPKAKSINKSRIMRGEAAGVCWVWGELCEEVAEGWGLAIEIVMVGWVLEEEAGCKCWKCRVCEESCPFGDKAVAASGVVWCQKS